MIDNSETRFGSARFASEGDVRRAGLLKQNPQSLFFGFMGNAPLYYSGMGGWLLVAGARGGKLRDILAYNICARIHQPTMLILDMKGELACISQDQTPDRKHCIYWNPRKLHGMQADRINPVGYATIDSPSLISDIKAFAEDMIPTSGSSHAVYFEGNARRYLEAVALTIVKRDGVLTLPELFRVINLIPGGGEAWLDFAFDMQESGFEHVRAIEEEIANSRRDNGGGFRGIMGELLKSIACLSDPDLRASVSPPFTFDLKNLTASDQTFQFYIMVPAEFIHIWSPVIKTVFGAAMLHKSRSPSAPRQTWVLDECAQLGAWPIIPKLFTYGAGIGIRPLAVFQSEFQMNNLGPNASSIIKSSAALQSYFAVRDYETAASVSRMIGHETLSYDDTHRQTEAAQAKRMAVQSFMNGGDPFEAMMAARHHQAMATMQTKMQRSVKTPDEILNAPSDRQFVFTDSLNAPIYAERRPYYEQAFMAGRYHPNPYYPPLDRVRVKSVFGHATKRIVRERVPTAFRNYPQYRDGFWSRVD